MVRYASVRLEKLICGGSQAHNDWTQSWKSGWLSLFQKGENAVLTSIEKTIRTSSNPEIDNILNHWLTRIKKGDLQAIKAIMTNEEKLNLDKYLVPLDIPCLFYGGDEDTGSWIGYENRFEQLKDFLLVTIPGGHVSTALSWNPIKSHIIDFLNE